MSNQLIAVDEAEWWPVYTVTTNLEGERMMVVISSEKLAEIEKVMNEFEEMQKYLHELYHTKASNQFYNYNKAMGNYK